MKINKRLIYRTLFVLICIGVLSGAYLMMPSGFQSRQAEGPEVLTELLKMAEESQPFNPDPYISSTYRPGDPLYEPVLAIQRERWDIAQKLLQPLVDQGNADAMYWLAHISGGSIYAGKEIARLFQKSAELGNPYAALRLDVSSEDCSLYLRGYCDPKWGELGRKILQQRAEQGDVKAEYYLLKYDENSSEDVHKKLEKLVTENAKNHYYQPLMRMVVDYNDQSYLTYFEKSKELDVEEKKIISKIVMLMVNNNYSPAILNFVYFNQDLYKEKYLSEVARASIKINTNPFFCSHYYLEKEYSTRSKIITAAACSNIVDLMKDDENEDSLGTFKYLLKKNKLSPLTESEDIQVKNIASNMLSEMTPMIYIDEMNPRL
ncbi:SEL1-like repeat protein [Vibrio mangrovi]|uniref:Sel1 repeat family protein n=1 Tax=Vibrio mangrovi TaxID=474394 RepID=A0A1Y6J350_9VIBR|nr:sel1 repeat family protein [Vibrio mangrovi]MDW6002368.1 sel1 repeat family protein [Vibrio mangrovi]SMS02733.1 hypothetical protein VIM7927_04070 [Vibrio mangrovi]